MQEEDVQADFIKKLNREPSFPCGDQELKKIKNISIKNSSGFIKPSSML